MTTSKPTEPREWEQTILLKCKAGKGMFATTEFDPPTHVIEYSAYKQAIDRAEKAEAEVERLKHEHTFKKCSSCGAEFVTKLKGFHQIDQLLTENAAFREALEFECGNKCAHENPCNARAALSKYPKPEGEK